jgi:hypothetical protein
MTSPRTPGPNPRRRFQRNRGACRLERCLLSTICGRMNRVGSAKSIFDPAGADIKVAAISRGLQSPGRRCLLSAGECLGYCFRPAAGGSRGVAQLGLERLVRDQEVAGSNPVTPICKSLLSSVLCATGGWCFLARGHGATPVLHSWRCPPAPVPPFGPLLFSPLPPAAESQHVGAGEVSGVITLTRQ